MRHLILFLGRIFCWATEGRHPLSSLYSTREAFSSPSASVRTWCSLIMRAWCWPALFTTFWIPTQRYPSINIDPGHDPIPSEFMLLRALPTINSLASHHLLIAPIHRSTFPFDSPKLPFFGTADNQLSTNFYLHLISVAVQYSEKKSSGSNWRHFKVITTNPIKTGLKPKYRSCNWNWMMGSLYQVMALADDSVVSGIVISCSKYQLCFISHSVVF